MGRALVAGSPPRGASLARPGKEEKVLAGASVPEIHRYPVRPPGFEEPLFLTASHRKEIAEHLAASPWLSRAAGARPGKVERSCHVFEREDGSVFLVRGEVVGELRWCAPRFRKRGIRRMLERWREVSGWREPTGGRDWLCFRVLASGGVILDLAFERNTSEAGEPRWLVIGVVD
jgi:hypothetical protein